MTDVARPRKIPLGRPPPISPPRSSAGLMSLPPHYIFWWRLVHGKDILLDFQLAHWVFWWFSPGKDIWLYNNW